MVILQAAARRAAQTLGYESVLVRYARPMYERTLAALAGRRGIPWTINGEPFRISPYHRHRMGAVYDPDVAAYLAAHVRPGAVCVDVGANVGVYALQFARWAGAAGRVVAFEPNPASAAVLAEHVRMNGVQDRVDIVQAAVADTPGTRLFHMAGTDGMSRLGAPNPEIAALTRPQPVRVTTLDEYCGTVAIRPDWVLVDVEGFEFAVLAGARRTIAGRRGRLRIVVEVHPDAWGVAGWTRESGEALLRALGLTARSLTGEPDALRRHGHALLETAPEA